ncbi:NAD(P)/FAD-dependent oxidoreductase [Rhodanobacter sp. Col0626]|uniref:NAD(P)/FAD-dependent oxidoreductase n=1 Tax=Rhodanobacter sp. Col0626 TaxID=3415679 RepID=UPI003CF64BB4
MSHRIVIVGGGAGGLELATALGNKLHGPDVQVVLVDSSLTHIWKPLLHEVAAGVLDSAQESLSYAAQAKWNHFRFVCGRMEGLDRRRRVIRLVGWVGKVSQLETPPVELAYDTLVVAVGSVGNDFGAPGVAEHCIFLDSTAQAESLRENLLERHMSHRSQGITDPLRIVIVGGGATGVELAAELFDANRRLSYYHQTSKEGIEDLSVILVEAGPTLLPALPGRIGSSVRKELEDMGIRVRTGMAVKRAEADGLFAADGNKIAADVMVWAAGVCAPAFLRGIDGLESSRSGQLVVTSTLQTTRDPDIFAFGDCAACPVEPGATQNVAALAQAAHQQASLLVRNLQLRLAGKPLQTFRFKDNGTLVSLASRNTFGRVFGNRIIEGRLARFFYVSLYRMHESALYGPWRTLRRMLGSVLTRSSRPLLKLH